MDTTDERLELLRNLADPVRLGVMDLLLEQGPASVSSLAANIGAGVPQLSNHLRRLRDAKLVEVEREGRRKLYRVADTRVASLLRSLDDLVRGEPVSPGPEPPFVLARTCYDHLAGRLGVALFDRLVELEAITVRGADVVPGPSLDEALARFDLGTGDVPTTRRRWALTCQDATEGRPHLGGALGSVVATTLEDRGWTRSMVGRREVEVTAAGRRGLQRALQLRDDFSVRR